MGGRALQLHSLPFSCPADSPDMGAWKLLDGPPLGPTPENRRFSRMLPATSSLGPEAVTRPSDSAGESGEGA